MTDDQKPFRLNREKNRINEELKQTNKVSSYKYISNRYLNF